MRIRVAAASVDRAAVSVSSRFDPPRPALGSLAVESNRDVLVNSLVAPSSSNNHKNRRERLASGRDAEKVPWEMR